MLIQHFESLEQAWSASRIELMRSGLEESVVDQVVRQRAEIDLVHEMQRCIQEGIRIIPYPHPDYPEVLRQIHNPPFVLFVRGDFVDSDRHAIAIVGARKASEYGRLVTSDLAQGLVQSGVTVVSGLAAGIDSAAHMATLTSGGRTIAVLGSGIDEATIYPTVNRKMARDIAAGRGVVISEYPPGTPPLRQHFPARNRIISGLSLGVVVVEAQVTSGSLITASLALEQGREVFAVPGSIFHKHAAGPHALIKKGAKLVEKVDDILEELRLGERAVAEQVALIFPENEREEMVLALVELEPLHIDQIVERSGMSISELNVLMMTMEMKGLVRHISGGVYARG